MFFPPVQLYTLTEHITIAWYNYPIITKALAMICETVEYEGQEGYAPYFKATSNHKIDILLDIGDCDCKDCGRVELKNQLIPFLERHQDETVLISFGRCPEKLQHNMITSIQYLNEGLDWKEIRDTLLKETHY